MKNKMNFKMGLLSLLLVGQSIAFAAGSTPTAPVLLQPIRNAKGLVRIDRFETRWDASKNDIITNITPICEKTYDIPVYDIRNAPKSYYTESKNVTCTDTVDTNSIEIFAGSTFSIMDGRYFSPNTDVKILRSYAYTISNNQSTQKIPLIPMQTTFSEDLNQVFFGQISMANSGMTCENEPIEATSMQLPVRDKNIHSTSKDSNNCTILSPVSYQVVWKAEDQP